MESLLTKSSRNAWDKAEGLRLRGQSVPGTVHPSFFERDTVQVARDLLGKLLVVRAHPKFALENPKAEVTVARIVETEAYHGTDPAAHCARGETPRCAIMFGDPGFAYVYFIYGNHFMLNFVTEKKGYPGAVLIRGVEPILGEELMRKRSPNSTQLEQLTSGPGKLCRALGIRMDHNGESLQGPSLYVVDTGFKPRKIVASRRIGISKGTESLWRFFIPENRFVSRARDSLRSLK